MALTDKLTAIGDAIREKTGGSELMTLDAMPDAIRGISGGGGGGNEPTAEELTITGDCNYRFAYGGWDWAIERYGNKMTTKDIKAAPYMFYMCGVSQIPFEINCANNNNYEYSSMFSNCLALEEIGVINNMYPASIKNMFENCYKLRKLPEFKNFNSSKLLSYSAANTAGMFKGCNCLREIDFDTLKLFVNPLPTNPYSSLYYQMAFHCSTLDSLKSPVVLANYTSNVFNQSVGYCCRLKSFTFETNEDGSPIVANWKSQIIDCSTTGHADSASVANLLRNPDMTDANKVTDDASYQALKDDPDWWTQDMAYSRYNHDSAVETINSLPDCSASGGTNTIKFKGAAGSKTDGGAINTLTEAEIAVATAKGWTVQLV